MFGQNVQVGSKQSNKYRSGQFLNTYFNQTLCKIIRKEMALFLMQELFRFSQSVGMTKRIDSLTNCEFLWLRFCINPHTLIQEKNAVGYENSLLTKSNLTSLALIPDD